MLRLSSVTHSTSAGIEQVELFAGRWRPERLWLLPEALLLRLPLFAPPGPYMLFILNGSGHYVGRKNRPSRQWPSGANANVDLPLHSSAAAGGSAFTLTVKRKRFRERFGGAVEWSLRAAFVGATQLPAAISAGDVAAAGAASITVLNPNTALSNALPFTITQAPGGGTISRDDGQGSTTR